MLRPSALVACNVYISAGRAHHAPVLMDLLQTAQQQCIALSRDSPKKATDFSWTKEDGGKGTVRTAVAIVHAYADGPYDRSSIHVAGRAEYVAQVASKLARSAATGSLLQNLQQKTDNSSAANEELSKHPFVGLVDHVAVMPLFQDAPPVAETPNPTLDKHETVSFVPPDGHGEAALAIGRCLETEAGVQVYYYGSAHPQNTPLATVRRERTSFFQSGGLIPDKPSATSTATAVGVGTATVGAPSTFVENFNIRLSPRVSRKMAVSLSKALRDRDGSGLRGVEALTLPYEDGCFEVATNLLCPNVPGGATVSDMRERLDAWCMDQQGDFSSFVEAAYRVGTTREQCLNVLCLESVTDHNAAVQERMRNYLGLGRSNRAVPN